MKTIKRRNVGLLIAIAMILCLMIAITSNAAYNEEGTTYVKVNDVSEIVPNARYIIIGEYDVEGADLNYYAMSDSINKYDDIRVGLAPLTYTDESMPNFVMSEDKESLTLHSDSILKVRLRSYTYGSHDNLYKMQVDGQGYLYGCCNSYYYYHTSCCRELPILNSTRGQTWWHFKMGNNGYWQISTYMYANRTTSLTSLTFNEAYGDFMSDGNYTNGISNAQDYFFNTYINNDKATNIWLYREVCNHSSSDLTHAPATTVTCTTPGNPEYWYCAGCETYFSKSDFSEKIDFAKTFIAPAPHTSSCGHSAETARFELYTDSSMGSDQSGERYLLIGKAGGKYYAMGNITNADGSRNAVEVSINSNGIITATSDSAEFLTYYWPESNAIGFLVDDCYFSALDGNIIAYAKELYNANGYIPNPASFMLDDYETGAGSFFAYSSLDTASEYIVFDEDTLTFKVQSTRENNTYQYKELCPHQNLMHTPNATPTCTEQGSHEFWYCDDCYRYYTESSLELPVEVYSNEAFTIPAFGHNFNEDNICETCGMTRIYSQISSLEEFDALDKKSTYIIVIKDGEKTYAAALPPENPCDIDSDGNGIVDIMEVDANENSIPDCIEARLDEWGADIDGDGNTTVEEYNETIGDLNEDEVVNSDDYIIFFEQDVYWSLWWQYDEENQKAPNFVEVTTNEDGTVTVTDNRTIEFQMMDAGVWGGQEKSEDDFEHFGILESERIRAAWIPNYWVGASGQMGYYDTEHFMTRDRFYGDADFPGIIDHKNWKISFNANGTACLVDTWEYYDNTGALQLVKYTDQDGNPQITIVGLPESLWTDSEIMTNATDKLPVYLYATEPITPSHTCEFGDWEDNGDGKTHIRYCTSETCNEYETEEHGWSRWIQQLDGTFKRTCAYCPAYESIVINKDNPINTTPEATPAGTKLTSKDMDLVLKVLTDEEQSKLANGSDAKVYLKVTDISTEVPDTHKAEAEAKAGSGKIGMYLDIDLFKQIDDSAEIQVKKTKSNVSISITVPEELINSNSNVIRRYKVIRVHEENDNLTTDVIEGIFNPKTKSIAFETDKFSTYALAYTDTEITDSVVRVNGTSLLLDGAIGVKTYFALSEGMTDVNVRVKSQVYDTKLEEMLGESDGTIKYDSLKKLWYTVTYIAPKDADNIEIKYIVTWGNKTLTTDAISVVTYIDEFKRMAETDNELKAALNLVTSLETYIAYADNYFTSDVALENVKLGTNILDNIEDATREGSLAGLEFYATSLILEGKTTIRHYFKVTDENTKNVFKSGDTELTAVRKEGTNLIYVDIEDIAAHEAAEMFVLNVSDSYTISYSPFNYAKTVIEAQNNIKLINLMKALVNYCAEAEEYALHSGDLIPGDNESDPSIW